jgi:hypothetical protein
MVHNRASDFSDAFFMDETVYVPAYLGYLSCHLPILSENQILLNTHIENGDSPGWNRSKYWEPAPIFRRPF